MGDPFRDSEQTALARVEDLEAENQRLNEELEVARDQAGSNHQAYVKHLEDQLRDLKKENAYLTDRLDAKVAPQPVVVRPEMTLEQRKQMVILFGIAGLIAAIFSMARSC